MKKTFLISGVLFSSVCLFAQNASNKKEAQIKVSDSKNAPQVVVVDSLIPAQAPKHITENAKQSSAKTPDVELPIPPSKNIIITGNKK